MAMGGSSDSQLLEEGHTLAEQWKASFVSSNEQTWSSELLAVVWKAVSLTHTELGQQMQKTLQ